MFNPKLFTMSDFLRPNFRLLINMSGHDMLEAEESKLKPNDSVAEEPV